MCGRFTLTADAEAIQQAFNLETLPNIAPRYNVAPSQPVAVITNEQPKELTFHQWGLIPSWAKDPIIGNRMINARSETAHEKPSFRSALKRRRCLIPATGFYEWPSKGSPPVYIKMQEETLFAFAGLWEIWHSPEGSEVRSCTILTGDTNDLLAQYHHRMPIILPPERYGDWLRPDEMTVPEAQSMFRPYDADKMYAYEVSKLVNSPSNDSPECIQPYHDPQQPTLL